jgi:nicotinamidase-related amidase
MQHSDPDVEQFSGFWDETRLKQTSLLKQLFDENVVRVFVCGIGVGVGVGRTARDAAAYGEQMQSVTIGVT